MKWCGVHKPGRILMVALACGMVASTWAQVSKNQIIERFKVPEFDANGVKKSEILGDQAEFLKDGEGKPDGRVKIIGLKIFLYKEGEVDATISASECTFDRKEKVAFSNGGVVIERGKMRVTGRGFRWASENQHIEILNTVRVVLQGMPVWQKKENP